jgi:hypothetical protein
MPYQTEAVRVFVGDDCDSAVLIDHKRGVDEFAVDPARERGLGQPGADRSRDLGNRYRFLE